MDRFFYQLECYLKQTVTKRKFLKVLAGGLLVFLTRNLWLKNVFAKTATSGPRPKKIIKAAHDLVLSEGPDPYQNTIKAIEALGGMGLFVKKGDTVVVKPNMAWDRSPEQAANTNPQVVAAVVDLCYRAGAKRVNVFDVPCNDDRRVYENSGIRKAAKEKGASVYYADHWNVMKARFPYQSAMEDWPILRDAIVCDALINVPVLKHHGLTNLTLSMKNLMGVCTGTRGLMHVNIGNKLVDLTDFMAPELTVIDATRVLTKNGPSGGSLDDVTRMDKIIAAQDPTLADVFACGLMKRPVSSVPYLAEAQKRNFGITDIGKADIIKVKA
jgi:uncharacterized protein (DUF362 family)